MTLFLLALGGFALVILRCWIWHLGTVSGLLRPKFRLGDRVTDRYPNPRPRRLQITAIEIEYRDQDGVWWPESELVLPEKGAK